MTSPQTYKPAIVTQDMIDRKEMTDNLTNTSYTLPDFNRDPSTFIGDTYSCLINTKNDFPTPAQIKAPGADGAEYKFKWNGITRILLPVTTISKPSGITDPNFKIDRILVKTSGMSLHLDEQEITDTSIQTPEWNQHSQYVGPIGAQYSVALLTGADLKKELSGLVQGSDVEMKNKFLQQMISVSENPSDPTKYVVKPKEITIASDATQNGNVIPQSISYSDAYMGTYALESAGAKTIPLKTGVICETLPGSGSQIDAVKISFTTTYNDTTKEMSGTTITIEDALSTSIPVADLSKNEIPKGTPTATITGYGYIAAMLRIDVPEDLVQEIYWSYGSRGYMVGVLNGTQQIACQISMSRSP